MPRHLRSATSKTLPISFCAARLPSRRACARTDSRRRAALLELLDRHQDPLQNIDRLEAGDDDRHVVARADRLVLAISHHGADVAGAEKALHAVARRRRIAASAGGTSTCDTSSEKLVTFSSRARQASMALAGAVVSKPMAKKTTCLSGLARAISRRRAANRRRARRRRGLDGEQIAVRAGHAQHVAEGREDDVGQARDRVGPIDHLERGHADRAAGTMHQLDALGQKLSSPYLTMECVWPPQTSISTQGRVWIRRISATILAATSPSRYSSRYFIAVAPRHQRLHGAEFALRLVTLRPRAIQARELIQLSQRLVGALRFVFIDPADGEADMDQHVIAGRVSGTYSRQASRIMPPNWTLAMRMPAGRTCRPLCREWRDT